MDRDYVVNRAAIEEVLHAYALCLDFKDWDRMRQLLADTVTIDYSSHSGRPPADFPADAWIGRMSGAKPGFDVTQHMLSNLQCSISGDRAEVRIYVRAEHFLATAGGDSRATLGGHYDMVLARDAKGWRITLIRLNVTWKTGNSELYALAFAGSNG